MGIILSIVLLMAVLKITGWLLGICGKVIGIVFSIVGYLLIAVFAVVGLGLAIAIVPVIFIVGLISIGFFIGKSANISRS